MITLTMTLDNGSSAFMVISEKESVYISETFIEKLPLTNETQHEMVNRLTWECGWVRCY